MQAPFLISERLYLRPIERRDLPILHTFFNDPQIRALTGEVRPTSESGMEAFLERIGNDPERVWFAIVLKDGDRVIGECGLLRMFPTWRTTDMSMIIGDQAAWGLGYGTEAVHLLLDYAFGSLNFHRIAIGVVSSNERALDFWEKAGFKREGLQRDGYFIRHHYEDFVMLSLLEDEFRAHNPSGTPAP
jgi:RimJ/RimL family protein N-acetyltransferase